MHAHAGLQQASHGATLLVVLCCARAAPRNARAAAWGVGGVFVSGACVSGRLVAPERYLDASISLPFPEVFPELSAVLDSEGRSFIQNTTT
jgi:hypothetical protein